MFCSRGQLCANGHIDHRECQAAAAVVVVMIGGGGRGKRGYSGVEGGVLRSTPATPLLTHSHKLTQTSAPVYTAERSAPAWSSHSGLSRYDDTVELQAPSGQSGRCKIIHTALQRGGGSLTSLNPSAAARLQHHVKINQVVLLF